MADGSRPQHTFNFPRPQPSALRPGEIVVDLFAGGGGASEALKQALGRDPDLAYNHDAWAVGMHAANHPLTAHHREDIWHADPVRDVDGRPVGWFHASPDCTHFSQAKGGQPRSRATRSLSWVVLKWAGKLARRGNAPRIISLENVEQILKWGPLVAKRDKTTGRVIKLDGTIAAKGERVSVWEQSLIPDKRHAGRTWAQFVAALRGLGYVVEHHKLTASDFGAGTSRKRLFMCARRDGQPVQWPEPTHGTAPGLLPLVTAADCIDFSDRGPSIFTRKKPLADATLRRIAKGVKRFVIDAAEPFIVGVGGRMGQTAERGVSQPMQTLTAKADSCVCTATIVPATHQGERRVHPVDEALPTITGANRGELMLATSMLAPLITEHANSSNARSWSAAEPLRTQCANVKGGHFAMAAPVLVQTGYGEREGQQPRALDIEQPLGTIVGGGVKHAVVSAFLEQANTGMVGHDARDPISTIVGAGSTQRLVIADIAQLSPEHEAGALRVAAFMVNYYGNGTALDLREPLDTITTRDRIALVTVVIRGTPYVIVDIALRMLRREELFRAQGFPADYIIDRTADGRPLSISRSVKMVGNSVSPPPLLALARANLDPVEVPERLAA